MIFLLAIPTSIGAMTFGKPPRFFPKYEQQRSSLHLVLFGFSARFQDVSGHHTVDYQLVSSGWWVLVVTRWKSIDGIRRITRRSRTEAQLQSDDLWRHPWCSGNGPCLSSCLFFKSFESACLDSIGSGMSFRARSTERRQCDRTSSEIHQETGRCNACWGRLTMLGLLHSFFFKSLFNVIHIRKREKIELRTLSSIEEKTRRSLRLTSSRLNVRRYEDDTDVRHLTITVQSSL